MGIYSSVGTTSGIIKVNKSVSQSIRTAPPVRPVHVLQCVDWKKYTAAEWLVQYNTWLNSSQGSVASGSSPLAIMIDKADTTRVRKSMPIRPTLSINDLEARAVAALLQEMLARIDLDESRYAWHLILRYEHDWSDKALSMMEQCTLAQARGKEKKALKYFKKRTGCK